MAEVGSAHSDFIINRCERDRSGLRYHCITCRRDLPEAEIGDSFYELVHQAGTDVKVRKFRGHEGHVIFRQGPPDMKASSK